MDYEMQKGEKEFRLVGQAHVAMNYGIEDKPGEDFSMLVRQVSIDKLQEESKKIGQQPSSAQSRITQNPKHALCQQFIKQFLNPKDWVKYDTPTDSFPMKRSHILELIAEA